MIWADFPANPSNFGHIPVMAGGFGGPLSVSRSVLRSLALASGCDSAKPMFRCSRSVCGHRHGSGIRNTPHSCQLRDKGYHSRPSPTARPPPEDEPAAQAADAGADVERAGGGGQGAKRLPKELAFQNPPTERGLLRRKKLSRRLW